MIRRRIAVSLAGAIAVLAMGGGAMASASTPPGMNGPGPSPAFPAGSVVQGQIPGVNSPGTGVTPDSISAFDFTFEWVPAEEYNWYYNSSLWMTGNYGIGNYTIVDVFGGAWSLYADDNNPSMCLTWDGGPNQIYEKPCNASKPSEQWASAPANSDGDWYFWNRYIKETYPNDCGNSYAPVITANAAGKPLLLECPEGGPTTYTTNQQWYAAEQQP